MRLRVGGAKARKHAERDDDCRGGEEDGHRAAGAAARGALKRGGGLGGLDQALGEPVLVDRVVLVELLANEEHGEGADHATEEGAGDADERGCARAGLSGRRLQSGAGEDAEQAGGRRGQRAGGDGLLRGDDADGHRAFGADARLARDFGDDGEDGVGDVAGAGAEGEEVGDGGADERDPLGLRAQELSRRR